MAYMFGKEEKLNCIVDVSLKGAKEEKLCLAYKTTLYAVFAPAYFHDDGYVLAVKGDGHAYYPFPAGAELASFQESGALPKALPPYQISALDYGFGYLLWIAIGVSLVVGRIGKALKDRRHRSLDTNLPPSTSPPTLSTKVDRWLDEEVKKVLERGEAVQQQAYGLDREANSTLGAASIRALYVVLTDRRLLVIHARLGAFGPLRENRGLTEHPRSSIARVVRDERHLRFTFHDGKTFDFFVEWSERHLSNQHRFLRDVPRLVGEQQPFSMASLEPS
ncbi:MAG TPA: hypothetical protein VG937_16325 [Polyangiaceae bacterium]|nr:hypothetical protein [Polyangiaceae bacterium]